MNDAPRSANDRLKSCSDDVVALSLLAAVALHFLAFQMWPDITVPDWGRPTAEEITVIDMPETPLPVQPEPLARPAAPVISPEADVSATIEPIPFRAARELPPPPPPDPATGSDDARPFVVYDVRPRLTNPQELERALTRAYPSSLREAGVGGTVRVQVHIDERGRVLDARVSGGSGYELLDRAAVELVDVMRFTPALNRDRAVAVWIELPIDFRVRS